MSSRKFISFGKPFVDAKEINSVNKVIRSFWLGTGKVTQNFENRFSKLKKIKHAISVNYCTAALHLSLMSLNLKKNDEVITTPMTFASTINSIILTGAKPVLVDIRPDTLNINEKKIEKKINRRTKALLIVHFAGLPCDMKKILKIVKKYKIKLIEDCAHAIETKYENKNVGSFGYSGCYSFYSNKNITTGEGGMFTCHNTKVAEKIKVMRLHGMNRDAWKRYLPNSVKKNSPYQHYDILYTGLKYNMIDLNAAIGIEQLKKVNKMWLKRKNLYNRYLKNLKDLPICVQGTKDYNYKHGYHLFLFYFDKRKIKKNIRDKFLRYLNKNNIGAGVNYRSITNMTNYKKIFKWKDNLCPISNSVGLNTVSLPLYPSLKRTEQDYIIKKVKFFFNNI